ncbi:MAG: protein kinase [Myxococcota bacterium]|nr:protein kinase [Myxococcota bacterium]
MSENIGKNDQSASVASDGTNSHFEEAQEPVDALKSAESSQNGNIQAVIQEEIEETQATEFEARDGVLAAQPMESTAETRLEPAPSLTPEQAPTEPPIDEETQSQHPVAVARSETIKTAERSEEDLEDEVPETKEMLDDKERLEVIERAVSPAPFAGFLAEMDDRGRDEKGEEDSSEPSTTDSFSETEDRETEAPLPSHEAIRATEPADEPAPELVPVPSIVPPVESAYQRYRQAQKTEDLPGRGRRPSTGSVRAGVNQTSSDMKLGAYRVIGELGSGGMAVIYKAVQTSVDRMVAIKELRPELLSDREVMARFEREATSMAALQHGNIVQIYDYVQDFDTTYIVMEYVEGTDLFDVLAHCQKLPEDVVAIIGYKIASALEYAHYRGIIHRDIKPSNVLMSNLGEIKLLDFGIARDPGRSNITQIGMALGTPAYMSPEQIRGEQIDFRADLFSLGVCLFEFLTGEKPWEDDGTQDVARKILIEPPRSLRELRPDVSFEMENIILSCLAKDANQRFASTFDLTRALQSVILRHLDIDSRQRLVIFLNNRQMISSDRASSLVVADALVDPELKRRDLGIKRPSGEKMHRQIFAACGIAIILVFGIGFFSNSIFGGVELGGPSRVVAIEVEKKPAPVRMKAPDPVATPRTVVDSNTKETTTQNPGARASKARRMQPGTIKITGSKKWYDVYIDGRKLYRHPRPGRPLSPGRYKIQLKNPTCRVIKKTIRIRSGQPTYIKATCRPK